MEIFSYDVVEAFVIRHAQRNLVFCRTNENMVKVKMALKPIKRKRKTGLDVRSNEMDLANIKGNKHHSLTSKPAISLG